MRLAPLLWWAGWLADHAPACLACHLPRPIIEAAYRQLWRYWAER
ncbi:MAG: hypothetical protein ACK5RA_15110 [Cyanobacteriota bacterium]